MKDIIQMQLESYQCISSDDEENAVREITQDIVLYALAKADFFSKVSFHGGTSLRIVHGLDRFSEDLDFVLNHPNISFNIDPYLEKVSEIMHAYGYVIEIGGIGKNDSNVRKRFLKDDSLKKIITFNRYSELNKKIKIKIELDVNPPTGAISEQEFVDFPIDFSILIHDLPSLFAGKCHALLCRQYIKGRDWYDFSWYVAKRTKVNFNLLNSALKQSGHISKTAENIAADWLMENLTERIRSINWEDAKKDVLRFVHPEKHSVLELWSEKYFLKKAQTLITSLE